MRRILVLRGGALGDFVVTLPALAALRARWPAARIELAGNATAAQLARTRGLLDAVHSQHEARWSALYGAAALPAEFRAFLAEFDLVLSFWPDPDGELAARFPLHQRQTFLHAPAMPTHAPAAAHYVAPLRALGLEAASLFHPLVADTAPRAGLTLHPGSGSPRKNWPAANWRTLLARVGPGVTLILGEAERDAWNDFSPPGVSLLTCPTLEELVTHLARTARFVGHDSGVSHLAAACGAPSVLLFGPTDPAMWAPPAPHVTVLRGGSDLAAIAVDDVLRAIAGR